MAWFAAPLVLLAALATYGAWKLTQEALSLRKPAKALLTRPDPSPEDLLADAYRQALRSVGDNEWLTTDRAADASLNALQARWREVSCRRPTQASLAPREWPIRLVQTVGSIPPAALDLIAQARLGLKEAISLGTPNERYATAHLAALRTAAAVLAARGRPDEPESRRARIRSAWEVLPEVAPELAEWSVLFAAGARKRARAEAGIAGAATEREANDLVRDASMFVRLVERMLPQLPTPDLFELTENQDTGAAVRQLSHGFNELFRALGPPPPRLRQLQPVPDGGGGTER